MNTFILRVTFWSVKVLYWLLPLFHAALRIALVIGIMVFFLFLIVILL